jgi:hypothetical protein
MRRTSLIAAAVLFSTAAYAQTPAAPQLIELDDDQDSVSVLGSTIDEVEDMELFDAQGTKLGEVEEVLGVDAGSATALAIDLEGSDDNDVVVELSNVVLQDNRLVSNLTIDQLRVLPVWND